MTTVNQNSFETAAQNIAQQYVLDIQDVKSAYGSKPETLTTLFNSMSGAKKNLSLHKAATILFGGITLLSSPLSFTGIPVIPAAIAVYCGLQWRNKNKVLDDVRTSVTGQIATSKAAAPAPAVAA